MKILLSAYLDHNLGDDLFVDYFISRYAEHEIFLICDSEMELNPQIEEYPNLRKVGLKQALKQIHAMDALVIIGGSIFQENPQFYQYDYMRNALVTLVKLLAGKVFILGSNIGPLFSKKGEYIFRYCFFLADRISVRDTASLALLQGWRGRKNYIYAPDIVFSYPFIPPAVCQRSRRLGISVINYARNNDEALAYIKKIAELINRYLEFDHMGTVCLFGFDGGHENDGLAIDQVLDKLEGDLARVSVSQYTNGRRIDDFLGDFIGCDYMVCSRFHSLVLSLKYGIRCFPIAYSQKTLNLLYDINYRGQFITYSTMDKLDVKVVLEDIGQATAGTAIGAHYLLESERHFDATDAFFGRRTS